MTTRTFSKGYVVCGPAANLTARVCSLVSPNSQLLIFIWRWNLFRFKIVSLTIPHKFYEKYAYVILNVLRILGSASKNLSNSNAGICPTQKKGYRKEFFIRILNSDITLFIFLLSEPEFSFARIVWPEKNRVLIINFSSEFWHCTICLTRIWSNPNFCQC